MIKSEYHKGEKCLYKPIICSEGYCSECEISRIYHQDKGIKKLPRLDIPHCRERNN